MRQSASSTKCCCFYVVPHHRCHLIQNTDLKMLSVTSSHSAVMSYYSEHRLGDTLLEDTLCDITSFRTDFKMLSVMSSHSEPRLSDALHGTIWSCFENMRWWNDNSKFLCLISEHAARQWYSFGACILLACCRRQIQAKDLACIVSNTKWPVSGWEKQQSCRQFLTVQQVLAPVAT